MITITDFNESEHCLLPSPEVPQLRRPSSTSSNDDLARFKGRRISFFEGRHPSHSNIKRFEEGCSTSEDAEGVSLSEDSLLRSPLSDRSLTDSDILSLTTDEFGRLATTPSELGLEESELQELNNNEEIRKPLFTRVSEVLNRRREMQQQRSLEILSQELQQTTFHPSVDSKSQKIFKKKHAGDPPLVFERLSKVSSRYRTKQPPSWSNSLTTRNVNNEKTNETHLKNHISESFLKRLELFQKRKQEHLKKIEEELNHSHTNGKAKTRRLPLSSVQGNCTSLYDRYVEKQKIEKKTNVDKELTFKPKLNRKSKSMTKNRSKDSLIQEGIKRANTMRNFATKEKEKTRSRLEKVLHHTLRLHPPIQTKAERDPKRLYNMRDYEKKRLEREQMRQEKEREKLANELEGCTFRPTINKSKTHSKVEKYINGLERFFFRVALAKRIEQPGLEKRHTTLNGPPTVAPNTHMLTQLPP